MKGHVKLWESFFFNNVATVNSTNANSGMVNGWKETSMPGNALADTSLLDLQRHRNFYAF